MSDLLKTIQQFFKEVKVEVKRVSWPTKKETTGATTVVIIAVFIAAVYLGLVDLGLSRIINGLIRR